MEIPARDGSCIKDDTWAGNTPGKEGLPGRDDGPDDDNLWSPDGKEGLPGYTPPFIPPEGLRLNLGCGRHVVDGWYCIDATVHPAAPRPPDLLCDVRKIPLPDGCAQEALAVHIFEHLYRWECDDVLDEWKRLLRPGATLTMEMPDLMKFCHNILTGREGRHEGQLGMWGAYGDPRTKDPYMVHKWGWTFATIRPLLKAHGFTGIQEAETQWHPIGRGTRDFRVEARKA